jgi:hypothetical protein
MSGVDSKAAGSNDRSNARSPVLWSDGGWRSASAFFRP